MTTYAHITPDPAYILQEALREGSIPHRDDKFLIHGPGGVGKSSLIAMFLGTQRDLIRISTPVATEPLHLTPIRDVSTSMFTAKWERVDYERLSHMVAHTCNELFLRKGGEGIKEREPDNEGEIHEGGEGGKGVKIGEEKEREHNEWNAGESNGVESSAFSDQALQSSILAQHPLLSVPRKKGILSRFLSKLGKFFKRSSNASQLQLNEAKPSDNDEPQMSTEEALPCLTTSLDTDPDNIQELFSNFLQGLQDKVSNAKEKNEVLLSHSIRIVDSGGQPQFH